MAAAVALLGASGCGGNVVVDKPGATGGNGGAGGSTGNGGNGASTADGGSTTFPGTTTTVPPGSPGQALIYGGGDVTVAFSSQNITCKNPNPPNNGCGWWDISIIMPESLLVPGTIDLSTNQSVKSVFQEAGKGDGNPNACPSGGGGGGLPAKLIIHQVSDASATVEIEGFTALMLDGKPDGTYEAPRCKNFN
jgi:hypothetical protein